MTWRFALLFLSVMAIGVGDARAQDLTVQVTTPEDGSVVDVRPPVAGTVSDSDAEVWVLVHPMLIQTYFVQEKPNVRPDGGSWQILAHVGRPAMDEGLQFEIIAIANPDGQLRAGMELPAIPAAEARSAPIYVTRGP